MKSYYCIDFYRSIRYICYAECNRSVKLLMLRTLSFEKWNELLRAVRALQKKISRIENLITPHHTTVGPLLDTFWIHKGDIFWLRSLLFARGGWLLSGDEQWLANSSPILPVIGAKLLRFIPVFQPNWTRSWFISSFKLWPLRPKCALSPKDPEGCVIFGKCKEQREGP